MSGTSEGNRRSWEARRRRYGKAGQNTALTKDERYIIRLYDRWLNVHDIRAVGKRAVEETA